MLTYQAILKELYKRRDRLDEAIAALERIGRRGPGRPPRKRGARRRRARPVAAGGETPPAAKG